MALAMELLVAWALYATLAQVGEIRTGHDATRGLFKRSPALPATVRAAVGIEEKFELLCYVQPLTPHSGSRTIYDTILYGV